MSQNLVPQPIQAAQAVLAAFENENKQDIARILPGFSMQLAKSGIEVTEALLKSHLEKGLAHLKSFKPASNQNKKRSYQDIRASLPKYRLTLNDNETRLVEAIEQEDFEIFKDLHHQGTALDIDRHFPLRLAAAKGLFKFVDYIYEHGHVSKEDGGWAAVNAMGQSHKDMVVHLYNKGAYLSVGDSQIAHTPAYLGDAEFLRFLKGKVNFAARNEAAFPHAASLHFAFMSGSLEAVKFLHEEMGCKIGPEHGIVVSGAGTKGDFDLVQYAFENGGAISPEDTKTRIFSIDGESHDIKNRQMILKMTCNGYPDVDRYIHDYYKDKIEDFTEEMLIEAAAKGRQETIDMLWHEIDVDAFLLAKMMYIAAYEGRIETIKHLRTKKLSDLNMSRLKERYSDHEGAVEEFAKWEADPNASLFFTAEGAFQSGNLDVIDLFEEEGVDVIVLARQMQKENFLFLSVKGDQAASVQRLHERGYDLEVHNGGMIKQAFKEGCIDVLEYMRQNNVPVFDYIDSDAVNEAVCVMETKSLQYLQAHRPDVFSCVTEESASALLDSAQAFLLRMPEKFEEQSRQLGFTKSVILNLLHDIQKSGAPFPAPKTKYHATILRMVGNLSVWEKMHGPCPKGLEGNSPYFFKPKTYQEIYKILEEEGHITPEPETIDKDKLAKIATETSYALAGLFGTTERALEYFERWGTKQGGICEISLEIELPVEGRFDAKAWSDAVLKHGPRMAALVQYAEHVSAPLRSDDDKNWSYLKTRDAIAPFAYEKGPQYPELAKMCFKYGWEQEDFDVAVESVRTYQKRYKKTGGVKPDNKIPDVRIDGTKFGKPGYVFYKLPDGDPRGLVLGELLNNCQHLASELGQSCAKHGFLSKVGGFYVVAHQETDRIIAAPWAWRGTRKELVLDSLESLRGHFTTKNWKKLCLHFAAAVKEKAKDVTVVHVGTDGTSEPSKHLDFARAARPARLRGYKGYAGDSLEQYVVPVYR